MLKRKENVGPYRKPSREEYAKVHPIEARRYRSRSESKEALKNFDRDLKQEVRKAVELFLKSESIEDLAKFNDVVLRMFMQIPTNLRVQKSGREFFYNVKRYAEDALREKFNELQEEGRRMEETIAYAAKELVQLLKRLESSVRQIATFISSQSVTNPDRAFSTGVNLDVHYGIDLIGVDNAYDPESKMLHLDIFLYQAKAARKGLEASTIRALPDEYARQKQATRKDVTMDLAWFKKNILDNTSSPESSVAARKPLTHAPASLEELEKFRAGLDNLQGPERFFAEQELYSAEVALRKELGLEIPQTLIRPRIKGRSLNYRYLVDTKNGLKILNEAETRNYED